MSITRETSLIINYLQMEEEGEMSVFVREQVVTLLTNLTTLPSFLTSHHPRILPFLATQLATPLAAAATLAEKEASLRVIKKAAIALSR